MDAGVAVPTLENFTAVSSTGGTALQFKKTTGAIITNILLDGYTVNVDMRDSGPVGNIEVDGTAMTTVDDDVFGGTGVDTSVFAWFTGE